ncbi:MAG TPA: peptidoglycan editing factor PgeF [Polyangiales bacterium]|nr:peptidoglycan editing factor PgeF [Polyangiales bacterium]
MRVLHSALLERHGFRHGFATRVGGVSAAPFDTLNLGFHLGDDDDAVRQNRLRFVRSLGLSIEQLFEQRQVHGNEVREVTSSDDTEEIQNREGDALVARDVGIAVAARTADCVPVLLAHPPSGDVAAVHAGWRGAVAGVVGRAVVAMKQPPAELVAAIGPHIRVGAFEVGEEVARELELASKRRPVVERGADKPHGDLAALIRLQLLDRGLPSTAIDDVGGCTHDEPDLFFSHRRDRGKTGRHLSVIVARPSR